LDIQNKALLLKNLHKFYNNLEIPWVQLIRTSYYGNGRLPGTNLEGSFWWKAHLKLIDLYKQMARCNLGNGNTVFFWTDLWNDNCLHQQFPHLITFVKRTDLSVAETINTEFLQDLFHLPHSVQAFNEFEILEGICVTVGQRIQMGDQDTWTYIWGNNSFSSKKAYNVLIGVQPVPDLFPSLWDTSCQAKHKFFFWLLLHDRLNTRNLLRRKNFEIPTYNCATLNCVQEETLVHLFWSCPFAQECWDYICPQRTRNLSVHEAFYDIRDKLNLPFSMDIIILAAWGIWNIRNNKIFKNQRPTFQSWKFLFHQELHMLQYRMKKKNVQSFKEWLQSQVA
jgi:hypothetical protein